MPLSPRTPRSRAASLAAVPLWLRWAGNRYALPLLFALAAICIGVGQQKQAELAALRMRVAQGLVPVWQALAAPGQAAEALRQTFTGWRDAYDENAQLRADKAALLQWREAAQRLAAENATLAKLANFTPPPGASAVTARVVADLNGPYQTALLVLAGAEAGLVPDAIVLGPSGAVIGRVTDVGPRTARVLLLNDPGSRIPVRLETSGATAIAGGTGGQQPELLYLPRDAIPQAGERVVTSGHGGIFPAGLPVGQIAVGPDGQVSVEPLERQLQSGGTPEIVRIVDFHIAAPATK